MSICIGYDDSQARDGAGSQLQKVIALYGLSKKFKLGFVFQGLSQVESNPGDGVKSREDHQIQLDDLNNSFSFENQICRRKHLIKTLPFSRLFRWDSTTRIWFWLQKIIATLMRRHLLFLIDSPYYFVERDPSAYLHFSRDFPSKKIIHESLQIHMHILGAKNSVSIMPERFVPLNWYKSNLKMISEKLTKMDEPHKVVIHTDAPRLSTEWTPGNQITESTLEYWKKGGLIDNRGRIVLNHLDLESEFCDYPNLEVVRDIAPLQAWRMITQADIFIGAKSSFSVIGAILSSPSLKIFTKFHHNLPKDWLVLEAEELIEPAEIQKFVYAYRANRKIEKPRSAP